MALGMAVVSDTAEALAMDVVLATVVASMEDSGGATTEALDVVLAMAEDSTAEQDDSFQE